MKNLATVVRSLLYPMVAVVMVGSLWALASAHAAADRIDPEYMGPLQMNVQHLEPAETQAVPPRP